MITLNNLRLCIITFLAIFLLPISAYSAPKIAIADWQENTVLTKSGKISGIMMKGKAVDLPANQFLSAFSISFDPKQNIAINKVVCDDKPASYKFENMVLTIKFPDGKKNNQPISAYVIYEAKYDKIDEFLRQEAIYVPSFASGANAKVVINFDTDLESATFNPNITKNGNSFIYNNIVPKDGVKEIIKLTPARNIWDVNIKVRISGNNSLNKVFVNIPNYFQSAMQKVENIDLKTNISPWQQSSENNNKILKFNTEVSEILIENKAKIFAGRDFRGQVFLDPYQYLQFDKNDEILLTPILEKIKQNPKYQNFPLYAKIGKFVHEYIKYDESYVGKLPKIPEIIQNPIGVCTEYSRLYNSLARIAKIPSIIVNGGACGEYDKCQGHSWNMIYDNGKWIQIDPTWDLMSGIVSSSHLYFSEDGKGEVGIKYFDNQTIIQTQMDFEMKKLQ